MTLIAGIPRKHKPSEYMTKSFHQKARDGESPIKKCSMCEVEITKENESDNSNRCQDCYEEWGDGWGDKV